MRRSVLFLLLLLTVSCRAASGGGPYLYISNEDSNDVTVIDTRTDRVVRTIPVGKRPRGLRASLDGRRLYVALSGSPKAGPGVDESTLPPADHTADGVGEVDTAAARLVRLIPSGQDPESFDLAGDGDLMWVSNEETSEASLVDLRRGGVIHSVPVGSEPEGVKTSPDGAYVYVTSEGTGEVSVVSTATRERVATLKTGERPRAVVFTPDGATAFVTCEQGGVVTAIDAKALRVAGEIAIPDQAGKRQLPMGAVMAPDGRRLYVTTGRGGSVAIIDVGSRTLAGVIADVGKRPWGIAITPDGRKLYTANGPSNDVSVIDTATARIVKRIPAGTLPWGAVVAAGPRG